MIKFRYHKRSGILMLTVFKKLFVFVVPKIELFPALFYRSVHCCDHGGRAMSGRLEFVWSRSHLKRKQRVDFGDGPDSWSRVQWKLYLKTVLQEGKFK